MLYAKNYDCVMAKSILLSYMCHIIDDPNGNYIVIYIFGVISVNNGPIYTI